jgi:glycine/D-amino acid oxidase-like deaminating enzyme
VILATGYVMPDFVHSDLHKIVSSWALATQPQLPETLWRDGVLIWEARSDYNYLRPTVDHRIIIGGEDEDDIVEPHIRDDMIGAKTVDLQKKLQALWPRANPTADFAWAGAFGTTSDGLPLIGRVRGYTNMYAAYGYGGNGITFSYLASRIIGEMISGGTRPWFDDFALDRDTVPAV